MLNKNALLTGVLLALPFPAIAWLVADYLLKNSTELINRPALPYMVAIALNLILLRVIFKKEWDKTGRWLMLATFLLMLITFMFKAHLR